MCKMFACVKRCLLVSNSVYMYQEVLLCVTNYLHVSRKVPTYVKQLLYVWKVSTSLKSVYKSLLPVTPFKLHTPECWFAPRWWNMTLFVERGMCTLFADWICLQPVFSLTPTWKCSSFWWCNIIYSPLLCLILGNAARKTIFHVHWWPAIGLVFIRRRDWRRCMGRMTLLPRAPEWGSLARHARVPSRALKGRLGRPSAALRRSVTHKQAYVECAQAFTYACI